MDIERFLSEHSSLLSAAFNCSPSHHPPTLPEEVRQAANLGWRIFPVSPLAKLTGNPNLLIAEAVCEVFRLEEFAAEYPSCEWRVAIGPSSLCVLQVVGPEGRKSFAALSQDQGECLTLQSRRGDTAWAFFRWPAGLVLRASARKLDPGLRILADGDSSCPVPPSGGCVYLNPWVEVQAVPCWLRELWFEAPDDSPGKGVPALAPYSRPAKCRSAAHFPKPHRGARKSDPVGGRADWRGGYRISRRR
jgi:hypothetical protein